MEEQKRPRVFSGIQPTGTVHLGNYIGALSLWVKEQEKYDNIFCIVDLHALTIPEGVRAEPLWKKVQELAALLLSCGIDPAHSALFVQSDIPAHTELTWLLNCVTPVGWLERMTQYKAKSAQAASVGAGLLDYPVLQAADILLYKTDLMPVGEDQKQHVELSRDIAQRFNHLFGDVFVLPREIIRSSGARIMGLDDPSVKMSKSLAETSKDHAIGLVDSPATIRKTIMRAVTDSGTEVRPPQFSPGVLNLLTIYEALSGEAQELVEQRFSGKGYGFLKSQVADIVISVLEPIRERYQQLTADSAHLTRLLKAGADRVRPIAEATLTEARVAVGLEPKPGRIKDRSHPHTGVCEHKRPA